MEVLVTGGAGYIGSHACTALAGAGYDPVILDNFTNSKYEVCERLTSIIGREIKCYSVDLLDEDKVKEVFSKHEFAGVMHFAGLKAVAESVRNPALYYRNNVIGSIMLLETMSKYDVKNMIFSSSATVYGNPAINPIDENFALKPVNPYGYSKMIIENVLEGLCLGDVRGSNPWKIVSLRYFNPIGAHPSGIIGEDPNGVPNNLNPFLLKVAIGDLERLDIYGDDYATEDGTGVRDYIHVTDLVKGHIKALNWIFSNEGDDSFHQVFNLGTGSGYSVLEMVKAYEKVIGKEIKFEIVDRREGDIAECYADASKAKDVMDWSAKLSLSEMVKDSWNWKTKNPNGYS